MNKEIIICKSCGNDTFGKGKLPKNSYTHIKPEGKLFGSSSLTLTICKKCGEIASAKVDKPEIF